ncbi:MAG: S41 family peptidase [Eubacteriales bacterium]|nr:S41 family peptidase [Eubacteriales bacterium]
MAKRDFWKGAAVGALCAAALAAGSLTALQTWIRPGRGSVMRYQKCLDKLEYMETLIDRYYLEEKDVGDLAEGLYAGLLYGLGDPYSRYYTKEEYEEENNSTEGSYVGIGVAIQKNPEGGILISECYEGGPGEAAGLEKGDVISAVDGQDVTQAETLDVVSMIRENETGSTVLIIHREDVEEALTVPVTITDVELPSVFHEMLEDEVGYLRISEFKGVTPQQFKTAMEELTEGGMKKLVVDLRDNPGGLLTSVCDVLRQILPEGLIVYTEDKYGNREELTCSGETPLAIPMAVLVNGNSASASEIFAGAVQDYELGVIVGTQTFGKGVVQNIQKLSDGSAVKLTVSQYFTPKGNSIHQVGILPDVEEALDNSLLNKEEITHEEDNQLQRAVQILREKS